MLRFTVLGLAAASALAAAPAAAQDAAPAASGAYAGVSGGYHDVFDNPIGDDGGAIGGVVAGIDVPLSANPGGGLIAGVEGNFHLGTGAIDSEYGVAGRVGYKFPSGGVFYVRGGYQWLDLDIRNLSGGLLGNNAGLDDTDGDYLVGVGGELPIGGARTRLRVGVDSVSFDTWRPNVAVVIGF